MPNSERGVVAEAQMQNLNMIMPTTASGMNLEFFPIPDPDDKAGFKEARY